MLRKELIQPQSSAFVPSKLKIGHYNSVSWVQYTSYGFSTKDGPGIPLDNMGALNPSLGYGALKVTVFTDSLDLTNVYATRPFLYNGRLYGEGLNTREEILALHNEWKSLDGQTIDVYLTPAGG